MRAEALAREGVSAMAAYQCCFLDERGRATRIVAIQAATVSDAQREAMTMMPGAASFSGFELWSEGRRVFIYRSAKDSAPEQKEDIARSAEGP